ncbi:MAG: 3-deoxy-7-phosphoheptulonate synthase, partial [Candidatus Limnocylindrus sp.]
MFVRMIKTATAGQLGAVRERAVAAGLTVYEEQGATGSTLAILGPSGVSAALEQEFAALPGVASAKRATRPYRLASREFRDAPTVVNVRDALIGGGSLTLMAGPCSIESRDQLFEVAQGVADAGATLLRGGAFKPRTSPYAFQGLGLDGL